MDSKLSKKVEQFLGLESSDEMELPPHVRSLNVRPASPAGMQQGGAGSAFPSAICSICIPTGENENEGG